MKKIIALILCVMTLTCLFTACGAKGKTLDEVKSAGKLTVATSPDFPPFESLEGGPSPSPAPHVPLLGNSLHIRGRPDVS